MRHATVVAGLVLGLVGVACGSSNNTTPGSCSVTVSGGTSASTSCGLAVATTAASAGKVFFGMSANAGGTITAAQVIFNQTSLQTGTYGSSSGTSVTSAAATVATAGGMSWNQFFQTSGTPDEGSFTLTISSTGSSVPAGSYTGWPDPDGSLTVTLEPEASTGAIGTVTMTVTF